MNYIEHLLILASTIAGYVSNSSFASVVGIPVEITSSAVGLKICVIAAGIKKYKFVIKKQKKNKKIIFLSKTKLNSIKVLIPEILIDYYISHDKFSSINSVLKEYDEFKTIE